MDTIPNQHTILEATLNMSPDKNIANHPANGKSHTSATKETDNGTNKFNPSPNQQQPQSASKVRLITDFLPPLGQILKERTTTTSAAVCSSNGEEKQLTPMSTSARANLKCHRCGVPYPKDPYEQIPSTVNSLWECQACTIELRDKLISELKEKQRLKVLEREKRDLQRKQEKEKARLERENQLQLKREAKEQEKEQIRLKRAEQDNEQSHSSKKIVIQTTINTAQSKTVPSKKKKQEQVLTPAELQKLEERKLIKQQLQIFSKLYPELVEKSTIKYPIEDGLIQKLPELHGAMQDLIKPVPHKVLVSGEEFDKLLYVWEFCNNFTEFLEIPQFKIEELKLALCYKPTETQMVENEEEDWQLLSTHRQISEHGFHLINCLFTALANRYLNDMFGDQAELDENQNQILLSVHKLISDKEMYWPEIVRLILVQQNFVQNAFGPSTNIMQNVIAKLAGMQTKEFNTVFTYEEKIVLIQCLIDGVHELTEFRNILNQRTEEKTLFGKEKIEIYAQIRELEKEQTDLVKKMNEESVKAKLVEVETELEELLKISAQSSRADSRKIKDRINQLRHEKDQYTEEQTRIEETIKRKQNQIVKINEKLFKSSIITKMLGKDANKVEYWHFKDDLTRIYIRVEEQIQNENMVGVRNKYDWFYYDEEDQFNQLVESLNPKGIREKKLQESLKRIQERVKLKKAKRDESMPEQETQHFLFQSDDYQESFNNAVWFGKRVPPKRKINRRQADEPQETNLSLSVLKKKLIEIALNYTDTSTAYEREWTDKTTQERWLNSVTESQSVQDMQKLLSQLDDGMSLPTSLIKRNGQIQRFKLQLFKYWPSGDLHKAWRDYQSNQTIQALSISVEILHKINEQFIVRQQEKAQKPTKKEKQQQPTTKAYGKGEFVKYFESSESEDEQESEPSQKKGKRRTKQEESSEDDEASEPDSSREWDEYCYLCDDGGNVICCDGCTNVAHLSCLKMKAQPKDDWYCTECLTKLTKQRLTRNKSSEMTKKQDSRFSRRAARRI